LGLQGEIGVHFFVQVEHQLVVDFGFSEQNGEFMKLLLAFFGCFAACFLSFFLLLRFEPNFGFTSFGSEL
jgi:hypothetical protein